MAKESLPYMPWFPSDYVSKTAHLSLFEDCAYRRLLDLCWTQVGCKVRNDLGHLSRVLRLRSDEERAALEAVIGEFMTVSGEWIYQENQQRIFEKARQVSKSRSNAGKKGGRPRKSAKTQAQQGLREESNSLANEKQTKSIQNQSINTPYSPPGDFDLLWDAYPQRAGPNPKKTALDKFQKLSNADRLAAIEGAKAYGRWCQANNQEPKFIPQLVTWINQRRWEDASTKSSPGVVDIELIARAKKSANMQTKSAA